MLDLILNLDKFHKLEQPSVHLESSRLQIPVDAGMLLNIGVHPTLHGCGKLMCCISVWYIIMELM